MPRAALQIFLSHKLGPSRDKAKGVAAALSVLANDRMIITYSADFERGIEWEREIRRALKRCHWFVLLYDGPDVNHDWCLFEAGFFRALKERQPNKRLICLHDPRHQLPNPLRGFTSVPAHEKDLSRLFRQIYFDRPWRIRPQLYADSDHEEIDDKVQRIIKQLASKEEIIFQAPISPSFTFHVKSDKVPELATSIPLDTQVSGDGYWEALFGKPDATVAWTWGQLVEGLDQWEPWAHQLAAMMDDAFRYMSVKHPTMALRIKTNAGAEGIYRVILRKLEKTLEESRFTFVAARIITSFEPHNHHAETRIFHLYNMAWFFRRRFLEKHLHALQELKVNPEPGRVDAEVHSMNDDMKALHAEAQVRGVENPTYLIQAFDSELRDKVKQALLEDWPRLDAGLRTAREAQPPNVEALIEAIESMDYINRFFLEVCLTELSRRGPIPLTEE